MRYGADTNKFAIGIKNIMLLSIPGLHLPQGPYDSFVYDFLYDFSAIVDGYWLCLYIVYEYHANSCSGFWRQTGTKLFGDHMELCCTYL